MWDAPCAIPPALGRQLAILAWRSEWVFVFEKDSLNSKTSKFLAGAADRSCSARALCLGLALLWSLPDLPAAVPKTSVLGYRSKIRK